MGGGSEALYREGESWDYTSGQLAELASYQDAYLERDSWFDSISTYIANKKETTTADILQFAIEISLDRINNGHQRWVGRLMRSLGWETKQTTRNKNGSRKPIRLWINPAPDFQQALDDF